jgi:hypothetical protein
MKATRTTSVALRRRIVTFSVNDRAVCLAIIAKVAVTHFQVPALSQFWRDEVTEKTVTCGLGLLGIRIGCCQKLRKILRNFSNIRIVIPIQVVDRQRVFKLKKLVNVTCKKTGSERASLKKCQCPSQSHLIHGSAIQLCTRNLPQNSHPMCHGVVRLFSKGNGAL